MPSVSADTRDDWSQFASVPMLAPLPEATLRSLWSSSAAHTAGVGDVIARQGDAADALLLLVSGTVTARHDTDAGRTIELGRWTSPAALDKVALLDGSARMATLHAVDYCRWRTISRERFVQLVDDVADIRHHVLTVLARHATAAGEKFVAASTLPTEARLAQWLLTRARTGGTAISLGCTQQELALQFGVTRVTLNRALHSLTEDGLIRYERRRVQLLAPEALAHRASGA